MKRNWLWPRTPVYYRVLLPCGRITHKRSFAIRTPRALATTYKRLGRTYVDLHPYSDPPWVDGVLLAELIYSTHGAARQE